MFTPKPHPDLHFASVGEINYRLISSDAETRAQINPASYIFAHFSPAFVQTHRQLLPELIGTPLSVGQSSAVASLLLAMGGTGFVMADQAIEMVQTGRFRFVTDAPQMAQPIYAAMHLRRRISKMHKRMTRIVQRRFNPKSAVES